MLLFHQFTISRISQVYNVAVSKQSFLYYKRIKTKMCCHNFVSSDFCNFEKLCYEELAIEFKAVSGHEYNKAFFLFGKLCRLVVFLHLNTNRLMYITYID